MPSQRFSLIKLAIWLLVSSLAIINVAHVVPPWTDGPSFTARSLSGHGILDGRDDELMKADWPVINPPSSYTGYCWRAYVPEAENWDEDTIMDWAKQGYESYLRIKKVAVMNHIVSAFWVPGDGVYLSSIPKHDPWVSELLSPPVDLNDAPRWRSDQESQKKIDRAKANGTPKTIDWHAEDGAIWSYENRMKSIGKPTTSSSKYPQRGTQKCYMASYGKRFSFKIPGPAQPCSSACQKMLTAMDIAFAMPDEKLNQ